MPKGMRKIVVDGEQWGYRISNSHVVARHADTNEVRNISASQLTNTSWYSIERSLWKGGNWHISPKDIYNWLSGKLEILPELRHDKLDRSIIAGMMKKL